ncbi:MAG: class I SAM-dependent DNA methyltransferase [Acidimicrobiales bacterium]
MADRGAAYQARFDQLAAGGVDVHGEADLVEALLTPLVAGRAAGWSGALGAVLDAGCGTGRVAIELARRGISVTGIDVDPEMLSTARRRAPELDWRLGDLATACLPAGSFDVVVLAGNVMIFVAPGRQAAVLANLAPVVSPDGVLVAGFQLSSDWRLADYDRWAAEAGLELSERWSTWDRQPWTQTSDYAVSVHARPGPVVAPSGKDLPTDQG